MPKKGSRKNRKKSSNLTNLKKEQELLGRLIAAIIPIGHSLIYETSVLYTILFSYKKKNHTLLLLEKKINYKTNL